MVKLADCNCTVLCHSKNLQIRFGRGNSATQCLQTVPWPGILLVCKALIPCHRYFPTHYSIRPWRIPYICKSVINRPLRGKGCDNRNSGKGKPKRTRQTAKRAKAKYGGVGKRNGKHRHYGAIADIEPIYHHRILISKRRRREAIQRLTQPPSHRTLYQNHLHYIRHNKTR